MKTKVGILLVSIFVSSPIFAQSMGGGGVGGGNGLISSDPISFIAGGNGDGIRKSDIIFKFKNNKTLNPLKFDLKSTVEFYNLNSVTPESKTLEDLVTFDRYKFDLGIDAGQNIDSMMRAKDQNEFKKYFNDLNQDIKFDTLSPTYKEVYLKGLKAILDLQNNNFIKTKGDINE